MVLYPRQSLECCCARLAGFCVCHRPSVLGRTHGRCHSEVWIHRLTHNSTSCRAASPRLFTARASHTNIQRPSLPAFLTRVGGNMAHHPPHSRRRRSESTSGSTSSSTSSASASASRDYSRDLSVDPPIFSQRSQTWMDFLRDSGSHPSPSLQPDMHAPLPPLPAEAFPHASSSHLSLPARPPLQPRTPSQGSSDSRKRRLTAGEPPVRRPSGIRVHSGPSEGSHDNPAVLDSSFVAHPPQRPPIPPRYPSQGNMTGGNDHAPPQWQPDSDVTHCFVCGSQFTFFYRKHHCR